MGKWKEEHATEYKNEFTRRNYDRIALTVPKGKKAEYRAIAEQQGRKLNSIINDLLRQRAENSKAAGE